MWADDKILSLHTHISIFFGKYSYKKASNIDQIESIWVEQLIILIGFDVARRLVIVGNSIEFTEKHKRNFNMEIKIWKEVNYGESEIENLLKSDVNQC